MRLGGKIIGERAARRLLLSDDPEENRATLIDHLEELRTRIFRVVVLLALGWIFGWVVEPWVYVRLSDLAAKNLQMPRGVEYKEVFRNFADPFMLKLRISFFIGLIAVFPFCLMQLWGFIKPGLRPAERAPLRRLLPLSALLFFTGASFAWIILPSAFSWFVGYVQEFQGASLFQEPGALVFFILKMILAFGVGFQLPLVVFFMAKIGLLGEETLARYWRQSTVFIFVAAAIITPSNDIFSMLMMAVPLTLLFFASVFAIRYTNRKAKRRLAEQGEAGALD